MISFASREALLSGPGGEFGGAILRTSAFVVPSFVGAFHLSSNFISGRTGSMRLFIQHTDDRSRHVSPRVVLRKARGGSHFSCLPPLEYLMALRLINEWTAFFFFTLHFRTHTHTHRCTPAVCKCVRESVFVCVCVCVLKCIKCRLIMYTSESH